MYLGSGIYASKLMEQLESIGNIEDPYLLVLEDAPFWPSRSHVYHRKMMDVINTLHDLGWKTVNITFYAPNLMAALLSNPRANRKNQG